ncbi:hypothetical protein KCU67_g38, partial [Aureobasidium melanogenum]
MSLTPVRVDLPRSYAIATLATEKTVPDRPKLEAVSAVRTESGQQIVQQSHSCIGQIRIQTVSIPILSFVRAKNKNDLRLRTTSFIRFAICVVAASCQQVNEMMVENTYCLAYTTMVLYYVAASLSRSPSNAFSPSNTCAIFSKLLSFVSGNQNQAQRIHTTSRTTETICKEVLRSGEDHNNHTDTKAMVLVALLFVNCRKNSPCIGQSVSREETYLKDNLQRRYEMNMPMSPLRIKVRRPSLSTKVAPDKAARSEPGSMR